MNKKLLLIAAVILAVGAVALTRTRKAAMPSDFRDAVGEGSKEFSTNIPEVNKTDANIPEPKAQKDDSSAQYGPAAGDLKSRSGIIASVESNCAAENAALTPFGLGLSNEEMARCECMSPVYRDDKGLQEANRDYAIASKQMDKASRLVDVAEIKVDAAAKVFGMDSAEYIKALDEFRAAILEYRNGPHNSAFSDAIIRVRAETERVSAIAVSKCVKGKSDAKGVSFGNVTKGEGDVYFGTVKDPGACANLSGIRRCSSYDWDYYTHGCTGHWCDGSTPPAQAPSQPQAPAQNSIYFGTVKDPAACANLSGIRQCGSYDWDYYTHGCTGHWCDGSTPPSQPQSPSQPQAAGNTIYFGIVSKPDVCANLSGIRQCASYRWDYNTHTCYGDACRQ